MDPCWQIIHVELRLSRAVTSKLFSDFDQLESMSRPFWKTRRGKSLRLTQMDLRKGVSQASFCDMKVDGLRRKLTVEPSPGNPA